MTHLRAVLLASLFALGACASLSRANYVCGVDELHPEGQFDLSVHYLSNPLRARLVLGNGPPIMLPATPGVEEDRPDDRSFGEQGSLRLEVTPEAVYLHRPGLPKARCEEFIVI